MIKDNKLFYGISLLIILVCCLFVFSCTKSVSDSAFSSKLDLIDVSISAGQYSSAIKMLKNAEKIALSSFQRLGIVKRYLLLSENKLAEEFLKKSIKKLPDNLELNAVYAHFLINQNRLEEAEVFAKKLPGSSYASIYSELLFKNNIDENQFYTNEYVQLYLDAANSTGDSVWLKNAAAISAKNGTTQKALFFKPYDFSQKDFPYFWALLEYDSENYVSAIETLEYCEQSEEVMKLYSDSLLRLQEISFANEYWTTSIIEHSDVSPLEIYYNASKYALIEEDFASTYDFLVAMIEKYPYSEKALALYGDFALNMASLKESNTSNMLKSSNIRTLAMEKIDSYPKIPISDVLYKMNIALEKSYSPALFVEYLKLKWISEKYTEENIVIDIWNTLEKTSVDNLYDEYILNFAISYLSNHHYESQAESLFIEYIYQKYGTESLGVYASDFVYWEAETAAWYCVNNKQYHDAIRIYENLCYERNAKPSFYVQMNLVALYSAVGEEEKALRVYGELASKNNGDKKASEIHYRIGSIQYDQKDKKNALLSLNYSIKLNPNNHKARLLLKKLN